MTVIRAVLAAASLSLVSGASHQQPGNLELRPCRLDGVAEELRCGSYEVWENRAARSGRRIPLRVVLLPARTTPAAPDPVVYLEGGPGASNVAAAGRFLESPLRDRRDILLIDVRGTGSSAPLDCDFQTGHDVLGFLRDFLPPAAVRACRDSLARVADLAQYVTPNVVDDLDEVREALGVGLVNLWGSSGGTRQALVWMRRHPSSVRSAILQGPVPVDARIPLTFAADAQQALDGVLGECVAEPACAAAFPDLHAGFDSVVARLARDPVSVHLTHPAAGDHAEIELTRPAFAQVIRYMLYVPAGAVAVPLAVHQAAAGNYGEIARRAITTGIPGGIAYGFYLSNTCSEDIPFIMDPEATVLARGTFSGRVPRPAAAGRMRGMAPCFAPARLPRSGPLGHAGADSRR